MLIPATFIAVADEGIDQGAVNALDFVGAGVSVTVTGNVATVTIAGGGGGGSATTVEVDLGAVAVTRGRFTITDAGIGAASKVLVWQAPGPYTGKGTRADESEMQPVRIISATPAVGSCLVDWETPPMITMRPEYSNGQRNAPVSTANASDNNYRWPSVFAATRIGKVRGNVKFNYMILS